MISEREPERWLPLPRKAAGAKIAPSRLEEAVTRNSEAGAQCLCHCHEREVNVRARNDWRASEVPAAAVIPSPRAYVKVVVVKKLVVGGWARGRPAAFLPLRRFPRARFEVKRARSINLACVAVCRHYFDKMRVFKASLDAGID